MKTTKLHEIHLDEFETVIITNGKASVRVEFDPDRSRKPIIEVPPVDIIVGSFGEDDVYEAAIETTGKNGEIVDCRDNRNTIFLQ